MLLRGWQKPGGAVATARQTTLAWALPCAAAQATWRAKSHSA